MNHISNYKISIEDNPKPQCVEFIDQQLYEFNVSKIGNYQYEPLVLFLRDANQNIAGGFDGFIGLGWLHVGTLWIAEHLRGCGYGRAILTAAEEEAIRKGCSYAYVFTYSFQAPEFYRKAGYEIFGVLDEFPPSHRRFFLKKKLVEMTDTQK